MQRHEMIEAFAQLGLKGMAGAFDGAVTTGLQRNRSAMEILADLLRVDSAPVDRAPATGLSAAEPNFALPE